MSRKSGAKAADPPAPKKAKKKVRTLSRRNLSLAWSTIRGRKGGFAAVLIAVAVGSAVITACGVLLETGIGSGVPAERYHRAAVVVGGYQSMPVEGDTDPRLSERVRLPADTVAKVAAVKGVESAVGDVSVRMTVLKKDSVLDGPSVYGHGWSASVLAPFTLRSGTWPRAADDVVLDSDIAQRAGVAPGDTLTLVTGSKPGSYRVSGIAEPAATLDRQSAVFFTDDQAARLYGTSGKIDAVGVLAAKGTDAGDLADRIKKAVPGVVTYTGDDRSDVETLDVGQMRSFVIEVASTFGATMILLVIIVVAGTLALSVQQRRRELALLRAVGATPRQVLRMIGGEAVLVGTIGAVLGAIPGILLAMLLHTVFAAAGALPPGFSLVITPLPVLFAVLICVLAARIGGWLAARRAAKVSAVEALGEVAVEPKKLGWFRLWLGVLLVAVGLAAAIVLPIALPGESAIEGAASSALVLVIAVGLLGPRLFGGVATLLGRGPGGVTRFLAIANSRARARRLSAATTPLIMAVTMASAQLFSGTTLAATAHDQASDGVIADHVVTSDSAGISPDLAEALRSIPGVRTVGPVARTSTILTWPDGDSIQYRVSTAQGVDPAAVPDTMNLDVLRGDLSGLTGSTVALSRLVAGTVGVDVDGRVDVHLGDGTAVKAKVVAIYENGLGFGDVTLPHDMVLAHTTDHLDQWLLVNSDPEADLSAALKTYPTMSVRDAGAVTAAPTDDAGHSRISLVLNAILLGYLAIAVVNTLVMATISRRREFALLRLVGTRTSQVRSMMRQEAGLIVLCAVVVGTIAALPSLIGMSYAIRHSVFPSIPPLAYLGIVLAAAVIAWPAVMLPARIALRPPAVEAITRPE
ncbi:ABC transporter permease [Streptosporangium roseum]|uniref:ABC-type transport system involved in lipoprotein release permease component-like protein n=1 Tax=Streptosporangium roseum (strain ATCC 12428 / DSM 43021 / JCM 3005 / KCTC 9067 / NCIMB 10171 / NRRL 2505 / NI 9100) TaxID=479432 RepID=D2B1I4_STRRD|nr:ABC-type transport system involved in lipoprotein release permease component-like protein [Streptosporangium roseum DSM 43021]